MFGEHGGSTTRVVLTAVLTLAAWLGGYYATGRLG